MFRTPHRDWRAQNRPTLPRWVFPEWMEGGWRGTRVRQCLLFEFKKTSKHLVHTTNKTRDTSSSATFTLWKTSHKAPGRPSPISSDIEISPHGPLLFPPYHVTRMEMRHQIWSSASGIPTSSARGNMVQDESVNSGASLGWSGLPRSSSEAFCSLSVPRWNVAQPSCVFWKSSQLGSVENGWNPIFLQNHRGMSWSPDQVFFTWKSEGLSQ